MADVQVDQVGAFRYRCLRQILQGHVVQEQVGQFGHGHYLFSQECHGVVAQIETNHFWQSEYSNGEVLSKKDSSLVYYFKNGC